MAIESKYISSPCPPTSIREREGRGDLRGPLLSIADLLLVMDFNENNADR